MREYSLNGSWVMQEVSKETMGKEPGIPVEIPGSVYSGLLENGKIEDPYYQDNELDALKIMDGDFVFRREFEINDEMLCADELLLQFNGLDTLADIYINERWMAHADNMHRQWEFQLYPFVQKGTNTLQVLFHSPTRYIKEENEKVYTGGVSEAMEGYPHLRKAHCMFGWDWGPRLPDAGIFRDVKILAIKEGRFHDIYVMQEHRADGVVLSFRVNLERTGKEEIAYCIYVMTPDGTILEQQEDGTVVIRNPELWWPNGYGGQPLYTVKASLYGEGGDLLDTWEKRIGLRTLKLNQDQDEWGTCFAHEVNGVKIFAMGADYVPEDNILNRITKERTKKLLQSCVKANHNSIRVWGGGYYPDDYFYDSCDELGLLVWQDFMYACANYELTPEFENNIRVETVQNVRRIRNHACLSLWCGNNEMETQTLDQVWKPSIKQKADYIKIFEYIIPTIVKKEDPETCYWPSSPSAGGSFDNPWDENKGDAHYWGVWHGNEPFTEFRNHFFRYLSEFGFQAFPCSQTIKSFTLEEDRQISSRVMEMHQRNRSANGKIMSYLIQMYPFPTNFEDLIYLSQLLQAEGIRYGIEHNRRNRGRCMGTIVWQLNDIWPVASWSSIDYYGRWKALHYIEKRSFAPIVVSCEETGEMQEMPYCIMEPRTIKRSARFNVCNETMEKIEGILKWQLRNADSSIQESGEERIEVNPLSASWLCEYVFEDCRETEQHLTYQLIQENECISEGTTLFTYPKYYHYKEANLRYERMGNELIIYADNFAKNVAIEAEEGEAILSDNYFDMEKGCKKVIIEEGNAHRFLLRCLNQL